MGFYSATPAQMEAFRRSIDANPERFRRIAEGVKRHGYKLDGEEYKRPKKLRGDALIDGWYNRKRIGLEKSFDLGGDAFSQKLPEILGLRLCGAYADVRILHGDIQGLPGDRTARAEGDRQCSRITLCRKPPSSCRPTIPVRRSRRRCAAS